MNRLTTTLAALTLPLFACTATDPAKPNLTGGFAITVAALTSSGVGEADYTVEVFAGGALVASARLLSSRYGDGAGSLSYVAPCDASAGLNEVRLTLNSLADTAGAVIDPASYMNPTPLSKVAECEDNADVPVVFNLTVARRAEQGFFDIAVSFSDVFCSAKFDCLGDDDQPIELLHGPDGVRGRTLVLGLACATGQGTPTWLHMSDVTVACAGGAAYGLSPAGEPGNLGPVAPLFYQTALYTGDERLDGHDTCYWNLAFGLADPAPADCTVYVDATASVGSWLAEGGRSPQDTIYPYLHFEVPITGEDGDLACGRHAVDSGDGRVATRYTGFSGAPFAYERRCGGEGPVEIAEAPRVSCGGDVLGLGAVDSVVFEGASGLSVAFDDDRSALYALPEGLRIGACCLNPCCLDDDPGRTDPDPSEP